MGWTVHRNDFGTIARALPREIDQAVQDMGTDMVDLYKAEAWKRTGVVESTISLKGDEPVMHAVVQIGFYLGKGFYSGFQEFGTSKQGARPVVVPGAHMAEPIFASYVERAVQRACRV